MFTQSIKFYTFHCHILIKEYRCLKNVIHQIMEVYIFYISMIKQTVNEGLHAFQQALRQNLSQFLSSQKKTHFWRGFFLKSTERQYVIL